MHHPTAKTCIKCGQAKESTKFSKHHTQVDGMRRECKACRKSADAERYQAKGRQVLLARRYGIGEAEYDKMLAAQGGGCALCFSKRPGGRWTKFHVDHCHETGRVRGILCYRCNVTLGRFGDDAEGLARVLAYVTG